MPTLQVSKGFQSLCAWFWMKEQNKKIHVLGRNVGDLTKPFCSGRQTEEGIAGATIKKGHSAVVQLVL